MESDSSMEFHAGPNSIQNAVDCFPSSSTGGPTISLLHIQGMSANYAMNLIGSASSASASITSSPDLLQMPSLTGVPASGQVYRFAPLKTSGLYEKSNPENTLFLYPNPSDGMITVEGGNITDSKSMLHIFNTLGETMLQIPVSCIGKMHQVLDVSQLPSGVYFIQKNNGSISRFIKY